MISQGRPRQRALPLAMFIAAIVLAGAAPLYSESLQGRVFIRNDGFALAPDLNVGRFGVGRLFFDRPTDVVIDEDGKVFVLDIGNNRVQVLDEDGRFLSEWDLPSDAGIERNRPAALAIKERDGTVFVLDGETARIWQFRPDGVLLLAFGRGGLGSGRMDRPVDLDVDSFGYVYVLDEGRKKVLKWHRSGTFVSEWGEFGARENEFGLPVSIAFSEQGLGAVYVLDRGKPALMKFSTDGSFTSSLDLTGILSMDEPSPPRLAVDGDGVVFIVEGTGKKLIKLDKRTLSVHSLEPGDAAGGVAVDGEGRVYVPDRKSNRLLRFTLEMK